MWRTCDTVVVGLQIAFEFDITRSDVVKVWFDDVDVAAGSSSTSPIHHLQHVRVAADETEVSSDAAAETLASVVGGQHQDDVTAWTAGTERLEMAELVDVARRFHCRTVNTRTDTTTAKGN